MIGLVLVTHGRLALELVSALEHVVGKQEHISTICIFPEDDMEERRADILKAVKMWGTKGLFYLRICSGERHQISLFQ